MSYQLKLKHLIDGDWVWGSDGFESSPSSGPKHSFPFGTAELVDQAVQAAEKGFVSYSQTLAHQITKMPDLSHTRLLIRVYIAYSRPELSL